MTIKGLRIGAFALLSGFGTIASAAVFDCTYQGGNNDWSNVSAWNSCNGTFPQNTVSDQYNASFTTGTVTLNLDVTINSFTQTAGTVTGTNGLTMVQSYDWSGGTQRGSGTTRAEGGMLFSSTNTKSIFDTRSVVNAAASTAEWRDDSGSSFVGNTISMSSGARLVNESGGTFNVTRTSVTGGDHTRTMSGGALDNAGAFNVNVDAGDIVRINSGFNNAGSVAVQQGSLELDGGGTHDGGSFSNASAANTLEFSGTHNFINSASVNSANTVFASGTSSFASGSSLAGDVTVTNGTVDLSSGNAQSFDSLTQSAGTVSGSDTVTITGNFDWSGGTHRGDGITRAEGGMLMATTGTKSIFDTRAVVNATGATAEWRDDSDTSFVGNTVSMASGARLVNEAGATFNVTRTSVTGGDHTRTMSGGAFDNAGTFNVDVDAGDIVRINSAFNNTGNVAVQQGRLELDGGGTHDGGSFSNASAANTLEFSGNHNFINSASVNSANTVFASGISSFASGSSLAGDVTVTNGTVDLSSGNAQSLDSLTQSAGTVTGSDTVTITGNFDWSGGTHRGDGITRAEGGMLMATTGTKSIFDTRAVINATGATAEWRDDSDTTFVGNNISMASGASLVNEAGATFNVTRTTVTGGDHLRQISGGTLDNAGDFNVNLGVGDTVRINSFVINSGAINVEQGLLQLSGGGTHTGSFTNSLTDSVLEFNAGTHSFLSGATFSGEMLLTSATLDFDTGTYTLDALTQTGGTVTGAGDVTITDSFDWRTGTHRGSGTTRSEGTMLMSSTGQKSIFDTRAVVNATGATAEWRDDSDTTFVGNSISMATGAALMNEAGAILNVTRTSLTGGDHFRQMSGGVFDNAGDFNVDIGVGDNVRLTSAVNNSGTINVILGLLQLNGGGTHTGAFNNSLVDSTLEFGAGVHNFLSGATFSGEMLLTSATLDFISTAFTLDALTQNGGTVTGDGTLTMTDLFTWLGGTHRSSGTTTAEGGMLITGTTTKSIFDTRVLVNAFGSTAEWRDASDTTFVGNGISLSTTATLANEAGATINVTRTSVSGGDHFRQISGGTFNNAGDFNVNIGVGDNVRLASTVNNSGALNVDQGLLQLTGSGTHTGAFNNSLSDSTLEFAAGTHNFLAGATFSGEMLLTSATLDFSGSDFTLDALAQNGGTVTGNGTVTMTDLFTWQAGTHRGSGTTFTEGGMLITGTANKSIFDTRTLINAAGSIAEWRDGSDTTFVGNSIALSTTSALQNDGTFNVTRSSVSGGDHFRQITGGSFVNNGEFNLDVAANDVVRIANNVSNPGTMTVRSGTLEVTGPLEQHVGSSLTGGTYQVFNDGNLALNSTAGGRSDITSSSANIALSGANSRFDRIAGLAANSGSFSLHDGRIFTTVGGFSNSGDVMIGNGGSELNVSGDYTQTGGTTAVFGKLEAIGTGSVDIQAGRMIGDGTVVGDVTNAGTIAPEGLGGATGGLSILGDYLQLSQGIFEVDISGLIAGDEYDFLDISGTANLAGTLDVTLADIFTPDAGDSFDILRAETIGTEFDILSLAPLGGNLFWDVEYLRDPFDFDVVRLTAKVVPVPAAVWLFGSGLIGLVGLARRRRTMA